MAGRNAAVRMAKGIERCNSFIGFVSGYTALSAAL
jgi:hypothetical protein